MQSSPPTRAWERPSSPGGSEYSLDLGALDMETASDMEVPKLKVDRIFSEDIDGPSDFTQNMDMWIRGSRTPKNTLRGLKSQITRPIQEDEEEEQEDDGHEHRALPALPTHTAADAQSNYTPENSPPKISVVDDTQHEDQFSSEWQADDSASTPAPPAHRQFLQPTVEDYHSELTPARKSSRGTVRGRSLHSPGTLQKQSPSREPQSTPGRASSPTLSPVRSPIVQRTHSAQEAFENEEHKQFEDDFRQLQAKCHQLEHLNDVLGQALEEEKRMRKQEKTSYQSQLAESWRREKDLVDMKDAAYRHNEDFRHEFAQLKDRLRLQEHEAESAKAGKEGSEQSLREEVRRLREQMQVQGMEHRQEVKSLQDDLELARRNRNNAEEAAKQHREDSEQQREIHDAEMDRIKAELRQAHVDESAIAQLEHHLEASKEESKVLKDVNREAMDSLRTLREQLAKLKQTRDQETLRLTNDRSRAVELASGLQRQLQDLRQQIKDEQAAYNSELEQLRSEQDRSSQTTVQELDIIKAELDAKQSELNEAILERDEAQDTLESRESNEEALKAEVQDMKAVNSELDARIVEKLQKRDKYWRDKLEEGDKERQLMAKALLHQWGREEVGIDSPQLYAYKHLNRSSPARSPTKTKAKSTVS